MTDQKDQLKNDLKFNWSQKDSDQWRSIVLVPGKEFQFKGVTFKVIRKVEHGEPWTDKTGKIHELSNKTGHLWFLTLNGRPPTLCCFA